MRASQLLQSTHARKHTRAHRACAPGSSETYLVASCQARGSLRAWAKKTSVGWLRGRFTASVVAREQPRAQASRAPGNKQRHTWWTRLGPCRRAEKLVRVRSAPRRLRAGEEEGGGRGRGAQRKIGAARARNKGAVGRTHQVEPGNRLQRQKKARYCARGRECTRSNGRRKSARKRKLARKSRRVRPTPLERLARACFHPLVLNAQGMPAGSFATQSMSMHCASSLWDCPHTIFSIGFVTGGSMRGTTFFTTFSPI